MDDQTPTPPAVDHWSTRTQLRPVLSKVLSAIEGAFGARLYRGVLSESQCQTLVGTFDQWDDETIVLILSRIISESDLLPSISQILRIKRQIDDERARPTGEPVRIDTIPEPLAHWARLWWRKAKEALTPDRAKRSAKYREIVEEAQRRGIPEFDWHEKALYRFRDDKGQIVEVRERVNCGWATFQAQAEGRYDDPRIRKPDRRVVISGPDVGGAT